MSAAASRPLIALAITCRLTEEIAMYLHPTVFCILAGCWVFSAAIACAFVRGASLGSNKTPVSPKAAFGKRFGRSFSAAVAVALAGVKSRYEKRAARGR